MAEHPPVRTLLALSTLDQIGANGRMDEADDHSHWLINAPSWSVGPIGADYALGLVRQSNDLCTVAIGFRSLSDVVLCVAERNGISDLDVDQVVQELWFRGPGSEASDAG